MVGNSRQVKVQNPFFLIFALGALFVMFDSFHLQFVRGASPLLFPFLGTVIMGLYFSINSCHFNVSANKGLLVFFAVICIYQYLFCTYISVISLFLYVFTFTCTFFIITLNDDLKARLISLISVSLGIILFLSIIGWILYLLHIPMPHHTEYDGVFYTHTFYPTFTLNGYPYEGEIPRFTAVFQEPGHCATTCLFLLFINKFNLKKWYNILFLVSILLSLSLAGYGLLIFALFMNIILYSQHRKKAIFFLLVLCASVTLFALKYNQSDNIIYLRIISRLEYSEDKGIKGNNRYSSTFESNYSRFIKSGDLYFGVGNLPQNKKWWTNSAGWKRALVTNGLIGLSLVVLFYFVLARKSKACMAFFLIWVISNMIRDHVLKEYWLFMFICAMPVLKSYKLYHANDKRIPKYRLSYDKKI